MEVGLKIIAKWRNDQRRNRRRECVPQQRLDVVVPAAERDMQSRAKAADGVDGGTIRDEQIGDLRGGHTRTQGWCGRALAPLAVAVRLDSRALAARTRALGHSLRVDSSIAAKARGPRARSHRSRSRARQVTTSSEGAPSQPCFSAVVTQGWPAASTPARPSTSQARGPRPWPLPALSALAFLPPGILWRRLHRRRSCSGNSRGHARLRRRGAATGAALRRARGA